MVRRIDIRTIFATGRLGPRVTRRGPASFPFTPADQTRIERLLGPRRFLRFGGRRASRRQQRRILQEVRKEEELNRARELLTKAKQRLLTPRERAELQRITAPTITPTRERPGLVRALALSPLERARFIQQKQLEAQRKQILGEQEKLDIRAQELRDRSRVLDRLSQKGLLTSGVVQRFNQDIKDFQQKQSSLKSKAETTQKRITTFKKPIPTRAVEAISIFRQAEQRKAGFPRIPISFISAQPIGERGAFGIPLETVETGRAFPVIRQMFGFGGLFREGAQEGRELGRFFKAPAIVTGGLAAGAGLISIPASFLFKPAGAVAQQVTRRLEFAPIPITRAAGRGIRAVKAVPFLRGIVPFSVAERPGGPSLITITGAEAAESLVIGASFFVPGLVSRRAPVRIVGREPGIFRTPRARLTAAQARQVILEAITEPTKPTTFPLSFRPGKVPTKPTLPISSQLAFKVTKKFIDTEAKIRVGIPEGQLIRTFKVSEVIPNIEKTRFVTDLAKEFGVPKKRIVNILKKVRIVSAERLPGLLGKEISPFRPELKGRAVVIDITKREIPGTIKHELTHAVQRELDIKGTLAKIEAQARKAEEFGEPTFIEGPAFPLSFKIKKPRPPVSGFGVQFPLTIKKVPDLIPSKVKPKPGRVFPLGLTEGRAAVLDTAGIIFKRPTGPKITRLKPKPFFPEFVPRKKAITIAVKKAKIKPKKPRKIKQFKTARFEPSTQAFTRATQRFSKRFFEDVEQRPFARFITDEARIQKAAVFPRALGVTATLVGSKALAAQFQASLLSPKLKFAEFGIFKEIQSFKALQRFKEAQLAALRVGTLEAQLQRQRQRQRQKQRQKELQLQRQRQITIRRLIGRQREIPRRLTRPKPKKTTKPLILFGLPGFEVEKRIIPKAKRVQGFVAFVKARPFRKRKFRKVSKPLPKEVARQRGFLVADMTIAQSVRLKKAKKKVRSQPKPLIDLSFKFRKKGNIFIEKRGFAIDTIGEKQDLTVAKFLAREKRLLNPFSVASRRTKKRRR